MKLLPASTHRRMPWKNGGGTTTEVAVSPPGAGLDDFDWRVSMARVERDGPFSTFAGIDRTLTLLEGQGIVLDIEGRVPLALTSRFEPVTFPADAPTSARLISGPILDLNVMSRRGRVEHRVEARTVGRSSRLKVAAETALLLCAEGMFAAEAGAAAHRLRLHDCLLMEAPAGAVSLSAQRRALVVLIEFRHI